MKHNTSAIKIHNRRFGNRVSEQSIGTFVHREVIDDVASQKSEIGIVFLSDFNRKALTKIFNSLDLEFTPLINCETFVYVWKGHPLAKKKYFQTIKVNDRATTLNLMMGLLGCTLCSGIICEELNGSDYVAIPFKDDEVGSDGKMEIGWILKKNLVLSQTGEEYIKELKQYFEKPAKKSTATKKSTKKQL